MATPSQWLTVQQWASHLTGDGHDPTAACILELRTTLAALTARIEALEAQAAQATDKESLTAPSGEHPDTRRLRWLMENGAVEGFSHVAQDRYELAAECAAARDRDEPNADDEFSGFRLLIDLAMKTDAAPAQAEQGAEPQPKSLWRRMNHAWLSDNVSPSDDWARVVAWGTK